MNNLPDQLGSMPDYPVLLFQPCPNCEADLVGLLEAATNAIVFIHCAVCGFTE